MNIKESIQQIETLIEAWQLDEADLNQTDINAMQVLLKENQELKKKYENAVADYETTMAEKNKLKKQLEEYKKDIEDLDNQNQRAFENMQLNQLKVCNMIKQQKEFIKWLERKQSFLRDEISELTLGMCNTDFQDIKIEVYEKVLQKYKKIIGDDK